MSLSALLTQLAERNIKISLNGEQLRIQAAAGALTPALKEQIAHYKAEILAQLESRRAESPASTTLVPSTHDRYQPFPLTDIQQAYWLGQVVGIEMSNSYHMYQEIDCAELDVERFAHAWRQMIERHDMLRASILPTGQQQIQAVVPPYQIAVKTITTRAERAKEAYLAAVRAEMAHQVFALDQWPLFDVRVTQIENDKVRIHLSMAMIMLDAGSLFMLLDEWHQRYLDPQAVLPTIDLSYRDYVLWNSRLEESELFQQARSYWQARGDTLPPAPILPTRPHSAAALTPQEQTTFVHRFHQLDVRQWQGLQQRAKSAGVTTTALLASAFAEILTAWGESEQFTLNCTFFNRPALHPQIHQIVGDFTAVTLLAVDHAGISSLEGRAKQLQRQLWQDLEHGSFTGVRVIRQLAARQKNQAGPLMPVVFTSMIGLKGKMSGFELTQQFGGTSVYQISQTPQVSLDCQVREQQGGLAIVWDAIDALFPAGMIETMFAAYSELLQRLVEDECAWSQPKPFALAQHEQEQRRQINDTAGEYPEALLHTLFVQQATATPQAAAIITADRTFTYQEVYQRANQVAHWLHGQGIGAGAGATDKLVAIVMEKGWEQIVAVFGTLLAGAAYVPIDPHLPTARQHFMLAQAEVQLVLTQARLAESLVWPDLIQRLCVDQQEPVAPLPALVSNQRPESLAYVLYTSGSTGEPKGVMIEHRSVVNRMTDVAQRYQLKSTDRAIALTALHHDLSVFDLFCMLSVLGGAVVVPDAERSRQPAHWLALLQQAGVTLWNSVPAFMQMLLEHLEQEAALGWAVSLPSSLRWAIFSGDFIPVSLPDRLRAWRPDIELIASGGPTETTVWDIYYPIGEVNPQWRSIPYGKPMRNAQYAVLKENLQPCPTWVPGELYIAGVGLARGYWQDAALTCAKFIHHPQTGQRLYRSGDRGRFLADGNIEILGRTDFQVKIRGLRIELSEIEAILTQHPDVQEAVVTVSEDATGQKRLVAYIVASGRMQDARCKMQDARCNLQPATLHPATLQPATCILEPATLRTYLQERLPDYMLPSAFVALDALPLSPNGKVDRKALPSPDLAVLASPQTFLAPRTPSERTIADIWASVLGLEQIGVTDNFFALGGHSLLATQVITRIRQAFALDIPLRLLFQHNTVAELSLAVDQLGKNAGSTPAVTIPILDRSQPLPVSFAQERLWFIDQLGGERYAYNLPMAVHLYGSLQIAALERSLQELVRRHESLRTTFAVVDESVVQVIHPANFALSVIDLTALPVSAQRRETQRLLTAEATQPFDLQQGPLLRSTLLCLSGGLDEQSTPLANYVLMCTQHHTITDGWSIEIFNRELATLYRAFAQGEPSPLPPLSIQYADFAAWQRQQVTNAQQSADTAMAAQLAYWQKQLSAAPALLPLPTDRPRPTLQTHRGGHCLAPLPLPLADALRRLSREADATLFMTLLAAFKVLLMRYSGQTDIVVGTPIANRHLLAVEPIIGFFANTLALRSDVGGDLTFRQLLNQVKNTTLDAYQHQEMPFEKVVEIVQPVRSLSHTPLFQVMFDLLKQSYWQLELPGMRAEFATGEHAIAKFDLSLSIIENEADLIGMFEYNRDLFDPATLERMANHFQTLLQGIVADPDQSLDQLPLLSQPERQQLLVDWNNTAADYALDPCIHHLFEQQVKRTPEAIAVMAASNKENHPGIPTQRVPAPHPLTLSYAELNARANQLAHYLQSSGVGPEVLVAVCLNRSIEMIVGVLGILKAGGAYVPLDPAYPQERLEFILNDAQAAVLLTETTLLDRLPTSAIPTICIDNDWTQIAQQCRENPQSQTQPQHLAYVIYTSGSTGNPKGVLIEHRNLVNFTHAATRAYQISATDRILQFASLSFDTAAEEIYPCLTCGATLILRSEAMLESVAAFVQASKELALTVWDLPTAYWHLITSELADGTISVPESLRLMLFGGERALPERVAQWQRIIGDRMLLMNGYGPTETTVVATVATLPSSPPEASSTAAHPPELLTKLCEVSIGRPLDNVQVYVLDRHQQPVPVGVAGELYIGGAGVARGYLNRPALTAEKFVLSDFGVSNGLQPAVQKLYRTGDLVRWLSDGSLQYLGRIDQQVKIRGFRIELGEIEAALNQHPLVKEAVVLAQSEANEQQRLVAYVVSSDKMTLGTLPVTPSSPLPLIPSPPLPLSPSALRGYLQTKLPDYMIPSAFVLLDAIPLTTNGKIDQKALAALSTQGGGRLGQDQFVAARTAIERDLAEIWQQLLRLERVSIEDNFFMVGGDSILSLQLVGRARQLGIQLTPSLIFQHQTIAALATVVASSRQSNSLDDGQRTAPQRWTLENQALVTGRAPFTPIQQMWVELQLPNPNLYNQSMVIEIVPTVEIGLLRQSLLILLRHHDALRLRYQIDATGWQQTFSPPNDELFLQEIEAAGLSAAAFQQRVAATLSEIEQAIDLASGPLTGLALLRGGADEASYLLWITHHLVVDYVSWRVLLADLETVYHQLRSGQPVQLPAKTTSFQQWGQWLQESGGGLVAHEIDYWVARFQHVHLLPVDCVNGLPTWNSQRAVTAELSVSETQALLQHAPAAYATQINDLLLTALLQTYLEWTGQPTLLIELEGHGREPLAAQEGNDPADSLDLSRSVGWFTSAFPVRLEHNADDWGALIQSVKRQLRQIPNHGLGFGILRYLQQDERLLPFSPPSICFNYLGQFDTPATNQLRSEDVLLRSTGMEAFAGLDTIEAWHKNSAFFQQNGATKLWNLFDLELMVINGQLKLIWLYSQAVHQQGTVQHLVAQFMSHLRSVIVHCQGQKRVGAKE